LTVCFSIYVASSPHDLQNHSASLFYHPIQTLTPQVSAILTHKNGCIYMRHIPRM